MADFSPIYDTFLWQAGPDNNYSGVVTLDISGYSGGRKTSLLRFDLSSLSGGTATAATLTLRGATGNQTGTITVARILAANSGWDATATWNYAKPSTVRWAGDAASNGGADAGCWVSGTDYSSTPLGSISWAPTTGVDYPITLDLTEFNLLLSANHGIILYTTGGPIAAMQPWAQNHGTVAYRPVLSVTYERAGGGHGGPGSGPGTPPPPNPPSTPTRRSYYYGLDWMIATRSRSK